MTARWLTHVLGAALLLVLVSCGSDSWGVKESDVPSEASLAFPGAELTNRGWNPGDKGTYIDGGSADYAPRLTMDYELAPTNPKGVLEWYGEQLRELGYTIQPDTPEALRYRMLLTGSRSVDGFDVNFGISGGVDVDGKVTGFTVTVVVTPT